MDKAIVGIVMGSDSDWPLVKKACDTLDSFGVAYETRVISADILDFDAVRMFGVPGFQAEYSISFILYICVCIPVNGKPVFVSLGEASVVKEVFRV